MSDARNSSDVLSIHCKSSITMASGRVRLSPRNVCRNASNVRVRMTSELIRSSGPSAALTPSTSSRYGATSAAGTPMAPSAACTFSSIDADLSPSLSSHKLRTISRIGKYGVLLVKEKQCARINRGAGSPPALSANS